MFPKGYYEGAFPITCCFGEKRSLEVDGCGEQGPFRAQFVAEQMFEAFDRQASKREVADETWHHFRHGVYPHVVEENRKKKLSFLSAAQWSGILFFQDLLCCRGAGSVPRPLKRSTSRPAIGTKNS